MSLHFPVAGRSTGLKSALVVLAASAACHSQTVVPALKCSDPCCKGQVTNIDCAENPDLSCLEDADPCVARAYGCADGSYYLAYPDVEPSSCVGDATAGGGGLVLGDAGPLNASDSASD